MDTGYEHDLRTGTHNGHLMAAALKRHRDRLIIHLGETTLTGGQVAERISQYIQSFESLGAGTGTPGGCSR
jgi:fatty-acyl-CoA synthase